MNYLDVIILGEIQLKSSNITKSMKRHGTSNMLVYSDL